MKQQTLADLLAVSQQTVSKIEQTEQMNDGVVERIANALGVNACVILHYDDTKIIDYLKAKGAIEHGYHALQAHIEFLKKAITMYDKLLSEESRNVERN